MADGSEPTILALHPGAEALAYAVTEGTQLLDCGVRPLGTGDQNRLISMEIVAAAEAAIDHFAPDMMAPPRIMPDGSYERSQRNLLSDRIRAVAVRKWVEVYRVARAAARKAVVGDPQASREEVGEALLDAYPVLETFAQQRTESPGEDVDNIPEALWLALAASRATESRRRRH